MGGGKISSEASYIYERSEYKSAGGTGGESERNLTNYFRSNLFQIFEDNNETINNICKSNTQKVND